MRVARGRVSSQAAAEATMETVGLSTKDRALLEKAASIVAENAASLAALPGRLIARRDEIRILLRGFVDEECRSLLAYGELAPSLLPRVPDFERAERSVAGDGAALDRALRWFFPNANDLDVGKALAFAADLARRTVDSFDRAANEAEQAAVRALFRRFAALARDRARRIEERGDALQASRPGREAT
jgi:hypothetical protein